MNKKLFFTQIYLYALTIVAAALSIFVTVLSLSPLYTYFLYFLSVINDAFNVPVY